MIWANVLEQLLKKGTIESVLKKNDAAVPEVEDFQKILYELGFTISLDPKTGKGDGIFSDEVVQALKSFCKKNNITSDGLKVTPNIAQTLIRRYKNLPALVQLNNDLKKGQIGQKYFKGSTDKQAVSTLQALLNDWKSKPEKNKTHTNGVFDDQTEQDLRDFMNSQGLTPAKEGNDPGTESEKEDEKEGSLEHHSDMLGHLLNKGIIGSVLKHSPIAKPAVKELKKILHKMGFGSELKQDFDKLDGKYSEGLINTVKSFASKNNLASDGKQITHVLGSILHRRYKSLPALHQLFNDVRDGNIGKKYFRGSKHKIAISALQTLLHDLGHGKELNWDKKENNGVFGKSTAKALHAFLKKGFFHRANKLTPLDAYKIFDKLGSHYGKSWKNEVKQFRGNDNSALTTFAASNFQGKVVADVEFVDSLNRINNYAANNQVNLIITSSYRPTDVVKGAVVPPAHYSNHMVGHAIDFNLLYEGGKADFAFFKAYKDKEDDLPSPVKGFIDNIRSDSGLRWGGDFHHNPDYIHIDDGLNQQPDKTQWKERYELTQKAWKNGDVRQV